MATWREALVRLTKKGISEVEDEFDRIKYRLADLFNNQDPIKIIPYRGWGQGHRLYMKGRVLEDEGIRPATTNDDLWDNLVNMYKRFESDEIPHARVLARYGETEIEVQADEEGFFEVALHLDAPLDERKLWHDVHLTLVDPPSPTGTPVTAKGEILVPPPTAKYVVISDIDDTVIKSDAAHLLRMARNVFLSNAYSRLPFPGVAGLYRALHHGGDGKSNNPLFYLSSSPWNLYDLLVEFFHLHQIPVGPVLQLRDWGITEDEILPVKNRDYKLGAVRRFLNYFPNLPFILIGDSAQEDPEIYAEVVKNFADRIMAVYIRNVSTNLDRPEAIRELAKQVVKAGSTLILADDTQAIAAHAIERGWIQPETFPDIINQKQKDEAPPSAVDQVLGDTEHVEKAPTPTVTVTKESRRATVQAVEDGAIEQALTESAAPGTSQPPKVIVEPGNRSEKKPE